MKKKILIWVTTLSCFLYGYLINELYRPYIYRNHINDYGIADIGNNTTFIPGVYMFSYLLRKRFMYSATKDIWFHFFILSGVETLSAFIPHIGTFDFKDILGLFIGAIALNFFVKKELLNFQLK